MSTGRFERSKTMPYTGTWNRLTGRKVSSRGFTLVELVITMSVLSIALTGIFSAVMSNMQLRKLNADKALARNAAERVLSGARGMPGIVEAYLRFGGGGPEEAFTIRGLQDPSTNETAGRVIVWRLKSSLQNNVNPSHPDPGSSLPLSQADILAVQASFASSFPNVMDTMANIPGTGWDDYIDTNMDGVVNDSDDPQIIGISVRIRWRSHSGLITQYFSGLIGRKRIGVSNFN